MKIKKQVVLKDALYNLASDSGASDDYCNGLTVGIVSALMAMGLTFNDAIVQVAINLPKDKNTTRLTVPDSWRKDLLEAIAFAVPTERNNDCDGNGPHSSGEVKTLASGGCANLILCHACFDHEIAWRKTRNEEIGKNVFALPAWETLKPYEY